MKKLFYFLLILPLLCLLSACGDDEPNPDNPEVAVPDPEGTITVKMRYDHETSINGDIEIDDSYNFVADYGSVSFVSIGPCKGLGNVTRIPKSGWASKVAITTGCGYLAYVSGSKSFYRLYVVGPMTDAGGSILGYTVKYQAPFYGPDEDLILETTSVSFGNDGGYTSVKVMNENVIAFSVESSAPWIHAEPASTGNSFLFDEIFIRVDPAERESSKGDVTVIYGNGKSAVIEVTRSGRPFVDVVGSTSHQFTPEGGEFSVAIRSNLKLSQLKAEIDQEAAKWLSANFEVAQKKSLSRLKYIGKRPAEEVLRTANESETKDYTLILKAAVNIDQYRSTTITISGDEALSTFFRVDQNSASFSLYQTSISVNMGASSQDVGISSSRIDLSKLSVSAKDDWCRGTIDPDAKLLKIETDANLMVNERQTLVSILAETGETLAELEVKQSGRNIKFGTEKVYFNRKAGTQTIDITLPDDVDQSQINSSANWLTATISADRSKLILRTTETQVDRIANITVSGFTQKLEIHQSKYANGDTYSENGVEGTVYQVENGMGKIYKSLSGSYAWSVENVFLGATDENDGQKNMEIVKAQPNWQSLYPAFAAVESLNVDGVSGWYLPAEKECLYIFRNGFLTLGYNGVHTSTETDYGRNMGISLDNNRRPWSTYTSKSYEGIVVAIRQFEY